MSDDAIDRSVFDELQDTMGVDFAAELVATFFDEAPIMLAELGDAAKANEADNFRRAAHSIKSNASVFGASALANIARTLEINGFNDDAQIVAINAAYERAEAELKALING